MIPTSRGRLLAGLLLSASLGAAGGSVAETAPPYAALLAQARGGAPRLLEAEADIAQARGLARQAGALPNPVLSLDVENLSNIRPDDGFGPRQTTASVEQTLELGGKRSARVAAGRAGVTSAEARTAVARADYAAQLVVAYAEAEAAVARVAQSQESFAAADADARAAKELVDAGREAQLRGLQAAAEREAARADVDEARSNRDVALARLSALAGSAVQFDGVSDSVLAKPVGQTMGEATTPAVAAARAAREAASARVRVESRQRMPDITVAAGLRRVQGDGATAFVAGVSAPLPLFNRNRGATDAARADLAASEARLRQAELDSAASLSGAQSQAGSASARLEAAKAGERATEEAYRLARLGYEAGRVPLIELSSTRRALAAARVRTLDAGLSRVRAEAEIARLTGRTPFGAQDDR